MKNIMVIDANNDCSCDLVSTIDNGTNSLFLEIKADASKNPILEMPEKSIPITANDFMYQIENDLFIGDDELTFRIVDDMQTGTYFRISKVKSLEGNLFLKQISNFIYRLSIQTKDGGGGCKCIVDAELSSTSENAVQNKVITARLNEVFQSVSNGKALIASAVTDKGVDTESDASFADMAENIYLISSGDDCYKPYGIITPILSGMAKGTAECLPVSGIGGAVGIAGVIEEEQQ